MKHFIPVAVFGCKGVRDSEIMFWDIDDYKKPLLAVGSFLSLILLAIALPKSDPEGQILGATLGGIGAAFCAPFWLMYRGKAPTWLAAAIAVAWVVIALQVNVWAAIEAGTTYTHITDYSRDLIFSIPGIGCVIYDRLRSKKSLKNQCLL